MLQRIDKVSVAYIISLFQIKIRSILPLNSNEVKMYCKNSSYKIKKASGMLLYNEDYILFLVLYCIIFALHLVFIHRNTIIEGEKIKKNLKFHPVF